MAVGTGANGRPTDTLVRMWQEVLRIKRVGIHDHFLELGGDSLLAVQITLEISDRLQVELPLTMIFDHPTVGELAEVIGQNVDAY